MPSSFLEEENPSSILFFVPKLRNSPWVHFLLLMCEHMPDNLSPYLLNRLVELLSDDCNRERLMLLEILDYLLGQYNRAAQLGAERLAYSQLYFEILRHGVSSPTALPLSTLLNEPSLFEQLSEVLQKNTANCYFLVKPL